MGALILLVIGGGFLVLLTKGLQDLFSSLRRLSQGHASWTWPKTTGAILTASVEERWKRNVGSVVFYPRIRYRYEVKGQLYESTALKLSEVWRTSHSEAAAIVARYPLTAPVRVAYHPHRPAVAVLEPGVPDGTVLDLLAGLYLLGGAAIIFSLFFLPWFLSLSLF